MRVVNLLFVFCLSIFLSACAAVISPKQHALDMEQQRASSFNVYEDNRVGLALNKNPLDGVAAINRNKDNVFGVSVANKIFNLLDVDRIEGAGAKLTVYLKSGESHSGITSYQGLAGQKIDPKSPALVVCTKDGRCSYRYQAKGEQGGDDLPVSNYDLSRDPVYRPCVIGCFPPNMGSIPRSGTYTLYVIGGPESVKITESRAAILAKSSSEYQEREQRKNQAERAAREAEKMESAKRTEQMRRSIKTGTRTNCGLVVEVKGPLALVETQIGQKYLEIGRLFHSGDSCRFIEGVYVGR